MPSRIIGMPVHYEMLVSHSPPVFSHSPPVGYLSDYSTNNSNNNNNNNNTNNNTNNNNSNCRYYDPARSFYRPQVLTTPLQHRRQQFQSSFSSPALMSSNNPNNNNNNVYSSAALSLKMTPLLPKRPCLVIKSKDHKDKDNNNNNNNNNNSAEITNETNRTPNTHKTKKKVVFADDQGHSLTEIRIMSEPSNVPPLWSLQFLAHVTQGLISPVSPEQWTINFRQPASDYLDFRRKLDVKNVSLENVIIKETESLIVGTVKVKNLSFQKEVFVRASWDQWKTQEDSFCVYSQIGGSSSAYVLYDTFSFKIQLSPISKTLEFCICFQSDGKEYWDNNDGSNYTIYKRTTDTLNDTHLINKLNACKIANAQLYNNNNNNNRSTEPINVPTQQQQKYCDVSHAKISSWSEFASWNHLENNTPYW